MQLGLGAMSDHSKKSTDDRVRPQYSKIFTIFRKHDVNNKFNQTTKPNNRHNYHLRLQIQDTDPFKKISKLKKITIHKSFNNIVTS